MPLPRREYDRTLNAEIERIIYQINVVQEDAGGLFWGLNEEQFAWSPHPERWSMAQCFDHLNVTNQIFLRHFEAAVRQGRADGVLSDGPYAYGFLSRLVLRLVTPPVKYRFKASAAWAPRPGRSMADITAEWRETHERFARIVRDANGLDIVKIKVPSPVSSLFKFSLGIGFWIMTAHDRRHIRQARDVRNQANFPAGAIVA